ncbi:MAG: hypothetical protein N4A35_06340 [Flavobacteriales bacterium]|jgi:hypothetical protein|nr:hypothetical protein [Flavobacteriales bacterium]
MNKIWSYIITNKTISLLNLVLILAPLLPYSYSFSPILSEKTTPWITNFIFDQIPHSIAYITLIILTISFQLIRNIFWKKAILILSMIIGFIFFIDGAFTIGFPIQDYLPGIGNLLILAFFPLTTSVFIVTLIFDSPPSDNHYNTLQLMPTYDTIKKGIPNTIAIPHELELFCNWLDQNGYPISGCFELRADDGETMRYWLGMEGHSDRFGIFGAGSDGSLYAFWMDDEGQQKIVHLGSEGGQLYILADNFIDFLRLLAIGYDEIGFADLSKTVEEWNISQGLPPNDGINSIFQKWVKTTFKTTIPIKGNEIVSINDTSFNDWINTNQSN